MESTRDIKGRIKSVTNIQQITKAMKMVAAARLRKAEEKANGSRPYAEKIGELLRRASSVTPGFTSPLFRTGEVKKVGYLVICGDKGLAGAYNSNVMKRTLQEIFGKDRSAYALYVCGKQAKNYLKFRGYDPDTYHFGFSDKPSAQEKERQDFLRIEEDPYIFLPDAAAVLSKLLPEYIQVQVYNAMLQSAASELGSRMAAMSAATDNATERIADLNLTYNKARQAQVTNEISEIVGGAAALE